MAYPQGYGHDERVQGVVANLMATDSGSVCFTRLQEPSPQAMVPEDNKNAKTGSCSEPVFLLSVWCALSGLVRKSHAALFILRMQQLMGLVPEGLFQKCFIELFN